MFYLKKNIVLLIFSLIFCLRFFGIDYGLPFFLVSDEEVVVGSALKMLQLKSIIPFFHQEEMKILIYPPFLSIITLIGILPFVLFLYIKNGFPTIDDFHNICVDNIEFFFLGARVSNIFFNLLILFIIFKLCHFLFNSKKIAIFSILFLASDFTFNFTSHFARHWNLTTLFIWLTIFFSLKLYFSNNIKNYIFASFFSGLGFGISYVFGSFGFLCLTLVHFIKNKIKRLNNIILSTAIFLFLAILSVLMHPYAFFRLIKTNGDKNVTALYSEKNFLNTIFYYIESLFQLNPVLLLLATLSIIYCFYKKLFLRSLFIFLSIFISFIILLHFTVKVENRYIMPVIPGLAIIASIGLNEILKNKKNIYQIFTIFVLLAYPLSNSLYSSYLLSKKDTRIQTLEWLNNNVKSNAQIANGMKNINLNKNYKKYSTINNDNKRVNLLGINKNKLKEKFSFTNISQSFVSKNANKNLSDFIIKSKFDYLLIGYRNKDNKFYRISEDFYKEINKNFVLLKKIESSTSLFSPPDLQSTIGFEFPVYKIFKFDSFGPTIEIYKNKIN